MNLKILANLNAVILLGYFLYNTNDINLLASSGGIAIENVEMTALIKTCHVVYVYYFISCRGVVRGNSIQVEKV